MKPRALLVVLFVSFGVLADPVPTKTASKKTNVIRTARKSTKDPPRPTNSCLIQGTVPPNGCDKAYSGVNFNCIVLVCTACLH